MCSSDSLWMSKNTLNEVLDKAGTKPDKGDHTDVPRILNSRNLEAREIYHPPLAYVQNSLRMFVFCFYSPFSSDFSHHDHFSPYVLME